MIENVTFDKSLIAPCGMNCGTCIAYLRPKNKCYGCRINAADKLKTREKCKIKNCSNLDKTESKFCYDCEEFPCQRIKHIDKRYRTKYRTSFIQNLLMIKETGIKNFLVFESKRRTCPNCGSVLSVHKDSCLTCNYNSVKINAL
jgi:ribosomal protein S27AE